MTKAIKKTTKKIGEDFVEKFWDDSWTYITTVVDVMREPILILDKNFKILASNEAFYKTFDTKPKDTIDKIVYELGNGQWDIPALKNLLEDILPKHTFFKGFEVAHNFPKVGNKIMFLNARQIYCDQGSEAKKMIGNKKSTLKYPPIILLAMEDVTQIMAIAKDIASKKGFRY